MRLSFLRQPAAKNSSALKNAFDLFELRVKILTISLVCFLFVGFCLLLAALPGSIQQKNWGVILILAFVNLWILAVALIPKIGYQIKAGSLIFGFIVFGLVCLLTDGLFGSGLILLLAAPLVAGALLSVPRGFQVFVFTLLVFVVVVLLLQSGVLAYPSWTLNVNNPYLGTWLLTGVSLTLVGVVLTFSQRSIMRGLETSVEIGKRILGDFDIERAKQEHSYLQNTHDLEQRMARIHSALEISQTIVRFLTLEQLLTKVVDLIQTLFHYYYVGVFLLDDQNEYAILKAGTGEAGEAMVEAGFRLAANDSTVVGWSIQHQQAKVAVDVGFEAVHFNNPYLSLTRSELVLPLIVTSSTDIKPSSESLSAAVVGHRVLGAITIQSVEAKAFDQADIVILQGVADVLATAIESIKLIQQLEKSLDESQKLHRQYFREAWKDISQEVENRQFSITNLPPVPSEPNQEKAGSEYSFPVVLRDQEIGQLLLELDSPELKNEDRAFIEAVTTQAAVALENIRLLEKNQRQADYERLLFEISRKVSRSTDLNTILQITLSELGQVMRATDGMIQLKVPAGEEEEKQR